MVHLGTGDYLIDNRVLVERKTIGDFIASLVDGRLFTQAARLAHSRYRSLLLIEGPRPSSMPHVHPHALEGALVSLAAMWRLPVLHSSEPEHSLLILQFLADQVSRPQQPVLRRFDRKPKRLASRRLFLLQGLPGIGPALAHRLLGHFGSIERVLSADASALAEVRGVGAKKAARIRELVGDAPPRPTFAARPRTIYIDREVAKAAHTAHPQAGPPERRAQAGPGCRVCPERRA